MPRWSAPSPDRLAHGRGPQARNVPGIAARRRPAPLRPCCGGPRSLGTLTRRRLSDIVRVRALRAPPALRAAASNAWDAQVVGHAVDCSAARCTAECFFRKKSAPHRSTSASPSRLLPRFSLQGVPGEPASERGPARTVATRHFTDHLSPSRRPAVRAQDTWTSFGARRLSTPPQQPRRCRAEVNGWDTRRWRHGHSKSRNTWQCA